MVIAGVDRTCSNRLGGNQRDSPHLAGKHFGEYKEGSLPVVVVVVDCLLFVCC